MKNLRNKRVLVTGGTGFIASHLCHRLVEEGARLSVLTRYDCATSAVRLADIRDRIEPVEADLRNPDGLRKIAKIKPHLIYHCAAYNHVGGSFENVSEAIDVNGKGTVNLLEAYEEYERFIYISSSEVYGYQETVPFSEGLNPRPISPYAVGKYAGELYARLKSHVAKKPVVVLRPFNAFGPYQSPRAVIAELVIDCLRGEDVVTTEGIQTREFNYVENLIDGFVLAGLKEEALGEVINLGSGREISIRELATMIHNLSGSKSRLRIGDLPYRPTEIWRMVSDSRKAKRILGWSPKVDLEEGLSKTIAWYRKFDAVFAGTDSPLHTLWQK
jgi:nucleoside-diphosphate-sugar epimerase